MSTCALPVSQSCEPMNGDFLNLIVRCYDVLIKDLNEVKRAHAENTPDLLMHRLQHAQDILTELFIGLDYERGGGIAVNLGRIYNYMLRELIALDEMNVQETLDRLISIAGNLRDAWVQVAGVA